MKTLVVFFILMFATASAEARGRSAISGGGGGTTFTSGERGAFSVGVHYGSTLTRLLNTDGSFSSFGGSGYGLGLDISIYQTGGPGEVRLFIVYDKIQSTSRQTASYTLSETSTSSGAKFFVSENLFVGAGLGQIDANITQAVQSSYKLQATYAVMGLEFNLARSFFIGLQGWYRSGVIRLSENSTLTQNSYSDNFNVKLVLIWCPGSTLTFSN